MMLSLRSVSVAWKTVRNTLCLPCFGDATNKKTVGLKTRRVLCDEEHAERSSPFHHRQSVFMASARNSTSHIKDEDSRAIVSKKIGVDGMNLSYDVTGSGEHRLFLLPGALGCVKTDFKYQMESMNKDLFTLYGWDPPGYGYSIPPNRSWPEHFLARDAELAAKMMKSLGSEKFSLLGWSDGGITALMVAARYPEIVQKLVVWGAAASVLEEEIPVYEKIRNIDSWSSGMRKTLLDVYKEDYLRKEFSNWVDAYTRYWTERKGDICREELDKITCPTLILHGAKDPLVPGVHPEFLAAKIKNSQLHVYPEGKHNIHQRYFKEFNSTVQAFLTKPESV